MIKIEENLFDRVP